MALGMHEAEVSRGCCRVPTPWPFTFLDFRSGDNGTAIGGRAQTQGRYLKLGGREHVMGAARGVSEDGAAEALPAALPPVTVNGRLQLVGVA